MFNTGMDWFYAIYLMRNCFIYLCFCVFYFSFVKNGDWIIPTAGMK